MPEDTVPLVITASSGAVSEVIGIVQNLRPGLPRYAIVAIVGTGEVLADIAGRLGVALWEVLPAGDSLRGTHVAITSSDPDVHQRLLEQAARDGMTAATLIHADTTIGPWVEIGAGCIISPGVRITGNVVIGRHCQLHTGAIVSHDDVLADHVTLSPASTLCGSVTVGARSTVFAGATVMPGVRIGADAIVGAGALVSRDVEDGSTVVGVPARPLLRQSR